MIALRFLILMLVFGISYTQDPLYSENQHTKFLHGLASAGKGYLSQDWLANTIDPLPAFSTLVRLTYTYLGEYAFYAYYLLLLGVYVWGLSGIIRYLFKIEPWQPRYLIFFASFVFLHCLEIQLFDFKTHVHLHYGLAEQYILGFRFQPSSFGILLIFSIYAFLFRHILLAIASLAVAATFHPTYIPSAALLGLAYMVEVYREEKSLKNVVSIGILSFAFLLPVVLYMSLVFAPTTPELWQQAQDIIVNFRIPHHSFPEIWLSKQPVASTVQILVMVVGIHLVRGTRLFLPLCIPFVAGVLLTFLQVLGGDNTVAFVAPWRISAFLVPVCTSIILAGIIHRCLPEEPQRRPSRYVAIFLSLAVLAFCTVRGAAITTDRFADRDATVGMMDFVKANKQPSDVYLVPFNTTEIWRMQRFWKFRLYTGAPIFINEKSHPYKDIEVLEWYRRVILAQQFYQNTDASRCETLPSLKGNEKITHIVFAPEYPPIPCAKMEELYNDGAHSVYRILP